MRSHAVMAIGVAAAIALGAAPGSAQDVAVPELSAEARRGGMLFMGKCASCHGFYAEGSEEGPPLLHDYYRPGHHSDRSFWQAVRKGSRQHHWSFGDMRPVEGVADADIPPIIRYVREMQEANGIR